MTSTNTVDSVDPRLIYRTPESRFVNLPDWPYQPHYSHWQNLRYHFVEELSPIFDVQTGKPLAPGETVNGPIQETTILCLHGEPTWSFLYDFAAVLEQK